MTTTTIPRDLLRRAGQCFTKAVDLDRMRIPYGFGGGHPLWHGGPLDCSGAASVDLRAGGLLGDPRPPFNLDTQEFETYGEPGAGLITVAVLDTASIIEAGLHPVDDTDALVRHLLAAGATHHCALRFDLAAAHRLGLGWDLNERASATDGWWQFTHPGGPTGWVGFDPTGFHLRHPAGL